MFEILFYLLVGHALADFVLQTDMMAKHKNRNREIDMSVVPPGQKYMPCWHYWLTSHALIHGGAVAVVTGIWWLGLLETGLHWLIDFAKCENLIGVNQDQALHIGCKLFYLILIAMA